MRFARRPLQTLSAWHAQYGDVFTVRMTGMGAGVFVADPKAIRGLFTGDQADLRAGEANAFLEHILGPSSVLVLDGHEHLRQRRLLLPPFQGSHVAELRDVIREVAEREIACWRPGTTMVLRERMRALTFEVICRVVFGVTDPARTQLLRLRLSAVFDTHPLVLIAPALRLDLGPLSPGGRLARRLREADQVLHQEIARRRAAPDLEERPDALSMLLCARDENGQPMTDAELRDELSTLLGAGHETTATALCFAFELLLRHPNVLDRLRAELADGHDEYLKAVVKETLRLRPVIDAAERTLTEARTIAGWELPPGIKVYPAIALVHQSPDSYAHPQTFEPERFLNGESDPYAWLPFGGGIRRCIGAALAQTEIAEVLRATLTRVRPRPLKAESDPVVLHGITLSPKHGVPVAIEHNASYRAMHTVTRLNFRCWHDEAARNR